MDLIIENSQEITDRISPKTGNLIQIQEFKNQIQQHKNEIRSLESNIDISRNWRKLRIHNSKLWKEYVG